MGTEMAHLVKPLKRLDWTALTSDMVAHSTVTENLTIAHVSLEKESQSQPPPHLASKRTKTITTVIAIATVLISVPVTITMLIIVSETIVTIECDWNVQ